ncbi:phosphotransferase [Anoxybacterium hadale]|uniref:Phosphotransferase n=1 Tax=Anoxybacterium hadale TaxID=3408580 RepID=A0ACD1ACT4_9FIRM|nr:phosphotransferase [Clostridiales bacterium]
MDELVQKKLRLIFQDDNIIFDRSRFAGGLTNYNYIMEIQGKEYVVRLPGGMTNQMIDRKIEKVNNTIACDLGLNSECYYFDDISGIKISVYLKNSKNIAQADPCDFVNIKAVSGLMKRVHQSAKPFPNRFDWEAELNKYEQIVREQKGDFFFDYFTLKNKLKDFVGKHITSTLIVPCHNDTVPENFVIAQDGRTYLIDWEYSGMNDPSWDVAAYILESRLTEDAIQYLLQEYYAEQPSEEELVKIKAFMAVQDLLWTVWALIRHYNGDDFLDYCNIRYERFRKNLKALTSQSDCTIADLVKS